MNGRIRPVLRSGLIAILLWGGPRAVNAQNASWTNRMAVSGDYRTRLEGFYNQKNAATGADIPARNRIRMRARLNLAADINPYTSFSLRLATGNPGDPISTNETFTEFFGHPSLNIDRAFIRFRYTLSSKPITLSADIGKFGNPAYTVSQVVWDSDVNPSGIVERLSVKGGNTLKQLDLSLMQYTIAEVSSGKDVWMLGAQTRLALAPVGKVDVALGVGDYRYFHPDAIAISGNTEARTTDNRTVTDPTGNITGFLSGFNLINLTGEVTIQTGVAAYPVTVFADYVMNTSAKKDAAGKKENTGVYMGVTIGRASKPGEVSLTGTYVRTRQDAALAVFNFSDVEPDGRKGGIIEIGIPILSGTAIALTGIFTNRINPPAGITNAMLIRTQADLSVRF